MGQGFSSSLAEWSRLRVSHGVAIKMSDKSVIIRWLDWGWGSASKKVPLHGCWQEASVPHHVDLFLGLLEFPSEQ